ncbi:MAG: hypothetical protein ACREIC_28245 [Limisphaerales bacterium]
MRARHGEWMENAPGRHVCSFETDEPPLEPLRNLSRRWPGLVFLLDYDSEEQRVKGLAKARAGILDSYRTEY